MGFNIFHFHLKITVDLFVSFDDLTTLGKVITILFKLNFQKERRLLQVC